MTDLTEAKGDPLAGTARLAIVVPVAMVSFFYMEVLNYGLPLYFRAVPTYEPSLWSNVIKYQVSAWVIGPLLAGVLARRYGERLIWSFSLIGKSIIPFCLLITPPANIVLLLSLWQGLTGAVMWIAGVSLIQMVPAARKGLSNGAMMVSMGIGSFVGPIVARILLHRHQLSEVLAGRIVEEDTDRTPTVQAFRYLLNFDKMPGSIELQSFGIIFVILGFIALGSGLMIGLWGQRPGRFDRDEPPTWDDTIRDVRQLICIRKFWILVIPLCLLGGPVFQTSNQFLPYRAEELGLTVKLADGTVEDHGWIWLTQLKLIMWIPGGLAVGLLAGKRAPGFAAVLMLGSFSLATAGTGFSATAWQLFTSVAIFEFVRQFMRWSHAGYMSEHLQPHLRPTAIGCAITFSGLGSAIFAWIAHYVFEYTGNSTRIPFAMGVCVGLAGTAMLFICDWLKPIKEELPEEEPATDK